MFLMKKSKCIFAWDAEKEVFVQYNKTEDAGLRTRAVFFQGEENFDKCFKYLDVWLDPRKVSRIASIFHLYWIGFF